MPSRPAPFRGQRYKRLKRRCLKRRSVFEDPEFPATDESLFYRRDPPDGVSWKRPGELCSDPRLFVDGISPRDLHQGSLGNCWFVAAASCLASEPSVWKKVIPNPREQDWDPCQPQRYCGIFRFCFWRWGHWTEVCVDDRLPCHQGKLLFCRSADPREFWSALLEKAYAKLSGCYEALEGGNTAEALLDFTGGISEPLTLDEGGFGTDPELQKQLFKQLKEAHSRSALISCSIRSLPGEGPEAQLSSGLVRGHAYGITAVRTVHLRRHNLFELFKVKKLQLIRLRNPWGTMEWNGAWSDKSPEWQQVSQRNRQQMGVIIRDDGEFWMSFEDFCTHFTDVVICRRMNTSRLSCQRSWVEGLQFGEWDPQKGRAGGCLNHRDTFLDNPQFFFEVSGAQDSVLISLQQQDTRQLRRSGSGGHNIPMGFELFSPSEGHLPWRLSSAVFQGSRLRTRWLKRWSRIEAGACIEYLHVWLVPPTLTPAVSCSVPKCRVGAMPSCLRPLPQARVEPSSCGSTVSTQPICEQLTAMSPPPLTAVAVLAPTSLSPRCGSTGLWGWCSPTLRSPPMSM
ncbi:calpain-5-like isoform X5 [Rhineura floridana]|uniref:calpain-5-like isoform X5 n=1 Tax=Rhineura floridana TaxID=261503 RepID=UPI002AC873BA|nr:calpain-5-like isoform X5 [Rhineura floridana]